MMQYAMNRLTNTKPSPVMTNVSVTVSSIEVQLDAIGVKYHGLRKWKTTVPSTKTSKIIAANIVYLSHPVQKMGTNAPPVHDHQRMNLPLTAFFS
jgi:hypothetical protein